MRVDEIQVGKVYEGRDGYRSTKRRIVESLKPTRFTGPEVIYVSRHGREIRMSLAAFARWAVREVPPVEAV